MLTCTRQLRHPQQGNPPYRRPCRCVRRLRSMVVTKFNASLRRLQLFYSFFKSLVGKEVIVELKNDLRLAFRLCECDVILCSTNVLLPFHLQHTRDATLRGPGEHWGRPQCTSPSAQWLLRLLCASHLTDGTAHSLPSLQYLNIKLTDISIPDPDKYPHMVCAHTSCCWSHPMHHHIVSCM